MRGVEGVRPTAYGYVRLRFQYARKALIAGVYRRALVNTRRRCFPGLNELPSSFCCAISNYRGPGPINRMAGCEAM